MLEILSVDGSDPRLVEQARELLVEYERELSEDLCFQRFEAELYELPGKYAPPWGSLLLGVISGEPVGCVALRPLRHTELVPPATEATNKADAGLDLPDTPETVCEMKRLYVRPAFRGEAFGRELAEEIVEEGRRIGYQWMVLDTLVRLVPAVMLYRSMGFEECAPYYSNPIESVVYLRKPLEAIPAWEGHSEN